MSRLTYTNLQAGIPENTTGLILPTNVRDITESYSMLKIIGDVSATIVVPITTPTIVPIVLAGVATPNMSINGSNQVVCALVTRYIVTYKVLGLASAATDLTLQLYYNGAAVDFSQVQISSVINKYVTLSGTFIVSTQAPNATIDIRMVGAAGINLTNGKAYMSVHSLPVQLQ